MSETVHWPWLYRLSSTLLFLGCRGWLRLNVRGRENIPATGGCLICANHASYLDPPVLACAVWHRPIRYLAKAALFQRRFFGTFLLRVGVLPVGAGPGDLSTLKKTIHMLQQGSCIGIFPEGTRTYDGQFQEPKAGIGFLIAKSGVPVVPAYIDGTWRAWPRGAKLIKPAKVRVIYGPPLSPAEIAACGTGRESYDRLGRLVMDRIRALQASLTPRP